MHADEPLGQASEAARYAVLRRVGPALRHDLIVNLQAVAMMTEVVSSRLDRGLPTLADLQQHMARIQRATREAVANSLRVATWLAPPEDDRIDLHKGIQECLVLARSGLEYRGFPVRAELPPPGFEVSGSALRPLLLSTLMHLTDHAGAAGELVVSARIHPSHALLTVRLAAAAGQPDDAAAASSARDMPYRPLVARDLQALATASLSELHLEEGLAAIRLERLVPTTALQIAPH